MTNVPPHFLDRPREAGDIAIVCNVGGASAEIVYSAESARPERLMLKKQLRIARPYRRFFLGHLLHIATTLVLATANFSPCIGPAFADNLDDDPRRPNIVLILADDLGYGDLSCYGATKIKTPNIDRLAREGIRFTDAHSAASLCSPSRYGLMTGRYPWRLHRKGNDYRLEAGRLTLASLLKSQGYRTAAIGKWHLGYGKEWEHPLSPGPLEAGFDYHFGVPTNHNDHLRVHREPRVRRLETGR